MYMRQKMNVKKLIALIAALAMLLALTACGQNAAQSGSGGSSASVKQHLRRSGGAPGR